MKYFLLIPFFILNGSSVIFAQEDRPISFHFTFQGECLELNKNYYSEKIKDSIQINTLKMYISQVYILSDKTVIDTIEKKYHLVDLEDPFSTQLYYRVNENEHFNRIQFSVGIDSTTNVSGAMGGDLDPTLGMYWAWQSGYINFKLEGKSKVCNSRKNIFQYHLGGYLPPNNSLQTISLSVLDTEPISVFIPIDKFLDRVDIRLTQEIMSPGLKAVQCSEFLSEIIFTR